MRITLDPTPSAEPDAYEADILAWRQRSEEQLRAENGWLTLTGLYWLHEGENTVGSDPAADVLLPESAPQYLGSIDFHDGAATLRVKTETAVTIEDTAVQTAVLRDDYDPQGLTRVVVGAVNFHVIKRADQYGIRVRDNQNPARQSFVGRRWFAIDPAYRVSGVFTRYPEPCAVETGTVVGIDIPMQCPGYVTFALSGKNVRLEAFSGHDEREIWFVFRETSPLTYRAGRFLYATVNDDGSVILDFNKAYNPPCAFTPYATCPLPPKANILPFPSEVCEQAQE